ncbi:MAG TPA: chromate transporter, partial [Humisphaera sp.]
GAGTPLGPRLPALGWPTLTVLRPGRVVAALAAAGGWGGAGGEMLRVFWFFLKVGGTLFGSGYVLVSYLRTGLVGPGKWLTEQQLLDAVAVGQVTPGPLLTTATFIGYVRGHAVTGDDWGGLVGAVVATVGIFLPSFALVAAFGRVLPALRTKAWARGALDGMNAAVVALLVLVTARLALAIETPGGAPDWPRLGLAAAALAVMVRWNVNSTWVIAAGALAGLIKSAF